MDDPWFHVAACLVDDQEDGLFCYLARLRCVLMLTTVSRSMHTLVGHGAIDRLTRNHANSVEAAIGLVGVPRPHDIALHRDERVMSDMCIRYGIVIPLSGHAWRQTVLATAQRVLISPSVLMQPRVSIVTRLVVRRLLCVTMTFHEARRDYCLNRTDLAVVPRSFRPPTMSGLSAVASAIPSYRVFEAALSRFGSSDNMRIHLIARRAASAKRAATIQRTAQRLDALADLVGLTAALPTVVSPDAVHSRDLSWSNLLYSSFDGKDDADVEASSYRARKIAKSYTRSPDPRLVDAAKLLCEQLEARDACMEFMRAPIALYRLHDVALHIRMYVTLGRTQDFANVQKLLTAWSEVSAMLTAGTEMTREDVRRRMLI